MSNIHRFKSIVLLLSILMTLVTASTLRLARANDKISLAVTALPPSLFNPYRNTGLPYVYTWSAVFDGLTAIDADGNVQPALATSWKNINPLTWVFHLRDDVMFSNGKPFTAQAVVGVVDFLSSDAAIREVVARMMFFLDSARALDEHTVEIKTSIPTPLLPRFLPQFHIVDPDYFREVGLEAFSRKPIATGPFIVEEIRPERVILSAFRRGWRAPVEERLEILAIPDLSARAQSVSSGLLDIALSMGPESTRAIVAQGGGRLTWRDAAIWAYNIVDGRQPALSDIRVREAINIAVDREAIIDGLLDGETVAATQPAPPSVYGFNPAIPAIPFDPERARQLIIDAGYPDGFEMIIEATAGSSANDSAVNLMVSQFLRDINVDMEVQTVTTNQIIRNVVEGTWKGHAFGLHYNYEPTSDVLRALDTHSCLWAKAWYCNQAVMPLVEAAQKEFDPIRNLSLRRDIMSFYRKDWAALFMYQAPRFAALAPGVSGLNVVNNIVSYDTIHLGNNMP